MSGVVRQLHHKNVHVPDNHFTLLDTTGISPIRILHEIVQVEEKMLGLFQNMNLRSCGDCTHRVVMLMGLCAS